MVKPLLWDAVMPKTKADFFNWCTERHLYSDEEIADLFVLSVTTVQQWREQAADGSKPDLPNWVASVAATFDHFIGDDLSPGCIKRVPRTKDMFFDWCRKHGLTQTNVIASLFRLSDQTVRNWEKHVAEGKQLALPYWVPVTIECFDLLMAETVDGDKIAKIDRIPAMTFGTLKKWQNRHGLKTYQDTGEMFRITRQAVHNWLQRESLPDWLAFSCETINLRRPTKQRKSAK